MTMKYGRLDANESIVKSDSDDAIAARIKLAMDVADIQSKDLAATMGVSEQSVYLWRTTGKIARRYWVRLCNRLGVSIEWLLSGDDSCEQLGRNFPAGTNQRIVRHWDRHESLSATDMVYLSAAYGGGQGAPILIPARIIIDQKASFADLRLFIAPDDSMSVHINQGDVAVVRLSGGPLIDGKLYLVDGGSIRQLRRVFRRLDGSLCLRRGTRARFPDESIPVEQVNEFVISQVIWRSGSLS